MNKTLIAFVVGIILIIGIVIAAYVDPIPDPGHGGEDISVTLNSFTITLQEAIDNGFLVEGAPIYTGPSTITQIPDPGVSASDIWVLIDNTESTLQNAIDGGGLDALGASTIPYSPITLGHNADEVWVLAGGVEKTLQTAIDEGEFNSVCNPNTGNQCDYDPIDSCRDGITQCDGSCDLPITNKLDGTSCGGTGTCQSGECYYTEIIYVGAGDGTLYLSANGQTWDWIRSASSGAVIGFNAHIIDNSGAAWSYFSHAFWRAFFPVNTASLPDNAIITSATFNFYVDSLQGNSDYRLVQTTQLSTANLIGEDYDQCGTLNNPTPGASDLTIGTTGWKTFTLNSAGRGWISKTGWTKLGIREQTHDGANLLIPPAGTTFFGYSIGIRGSAYAGTNPYLSVTYTLP